MQKLTVLLIIVFASSAFANPTTYWRKDELAGYSSSLIGKVKDQVAVEQLGVFGSHSALMVHRTGTGTSELHSADTDFYVVQTGEATLHIGGKTSKPSLTATGLPPHNECITILTNTACIGNAVLVSWGKRLKSLKTHGYSRNRYPAPIDRKRLPRNKTRATRKQE